MDRYSWDSEKKENFRAFFQNIEFKREYDNIKRKLERGETAGVVNRVNNAMKGALTDMRKKDRGGKRVGWFSKRCKEKRKEVKGLLKEFRKENRESAREKFCQGRSEYRRVLKEARKE